MWLHLAYYYILDTQPATWDTRTTRISSAAISAHNVKHWTVYNVLYLGSTIAECMWKSPTHSLKIFRSKKVRQEQNEIRVHLQTIHLCAKQKQGGWRGAFQREKLQKFFSWSLSHRASSYYFIKKLADCPFRLSLEKSSE